MNHDEREQSTGLAPGPAAPGKPSRPRRRLPSHLVRRVGWGLGDQVLSSVTNFALTLVVAAVLAPAQFGAFTVIITVYGVCLGMSAGLSSSPLVVRYSAAADAIQQVAKREAVGAAALLGLASGVVCLGVGAIAGHALGPALMALGVTLPGLLIQDAWRYAFVAEGKPARAAANDAVWAVLQAAGIGALLVADAKTAPLLVLVWGASASVAALVGWVQSGGPPALSRGVPWLRQHRDIGPPFALEYVAHRSGLWAAVIVVGAISGLSTVAALRGAFLLVAGPLNLLFLAVGFVGVPEGARVYARTPERLPRTVRLIALALAACALAWGAAVLALPDSVGERLLGETWPLASPLLGVLVILSVAQALSLGPGQGLRVLAAARRTLATQLVGVALLLVAAPIGAVVGGARGAALAMTVAVALTTLLRWQQFVAAYAQARRGRGQPTVPLKADPAEPEVTFS